MRVARWIIRPLLLLMSCFVSAPFTVAQRPSTQNEDVVKVNTALVQTDFMVFDKQGSFVDGLKRDQFTLKVEGKSREITFFDRVAAGSRNEEAQLAAARGLTAGGKTTAVPLDRGRVVMFFLDDLHLSLSSVKRAKELLKRFVDREMGQNDLAEIVSTSGQLGFLQQLTDNQTVLDTAIDRLQFRELTVATTTETPPMTEYLAQKVEQRDSDALDYYVDAILKENPMIPRETAAQMVQDRARRILQEVSSITTRSMSTLKNWLQQTSSIPGRKLVFFISDGFLIDRIYSNNDDRLFDITSSAARSSTVIYSIDARGLSTGTPDASALVPVDTSGRLFRAQGGELAASQEALTVLAADTGGRALLNSNDLSAALMRGLKETSIYYLVAWRPDNDEQRNPKYRRIEISIAGHPDWMVRFRRASGTLELEQAANSKPPPVSDPNVAAARITNLLRAPLPENSLPVAITLNFLDTAESGMSLTASIDVRTTSLALESVNGITTGIVDLGGAVLNDQGKSVSTFNKRFTIRGPADPTIAKPPEHVLYNHLASIKPGLYQVRVAALDAQRGTSGSAHAWIEIPDLQSKNLTLSTLIVGEGKENTATATGGNADNAPNSSPINKVALNVRHLFAQSSYLRFFTYVYNAAHGADAATTGPDLAVQVQVFRDNEPVVTTPLHTIVTEGMNDLQRIPYAADVSLSNLSPGAYVLRVTVIDRRAKASATQKFSFQIE